MPVARRLLFLLGLRAPHDLCGSPPTSERKECRTGVNPQAMPVGQQQGEICVEQYGVFGFLQATELTPEQRQAMTPRSSATTTKIEE